MKTNKTITIIGFVAMVLLMGLNSHAIYDEMSTQIKLTNHSTSDAMVGDFAFSFNVYSVSTGGSSLYEHNETLTTDSNGVCNVILTSVDLPFDVDYWFSVNVNDTGEMSTRVKITDVANAMRSNETEYFNNHNSNYYWNTSTDLIEESELNTLTELDTQIGITGTADATTFLRGDNSWVTPTDTNTNANTICSGGTTYLDGEGNCDDISSVYAPINYGDDWNKTYADSLYYDINNPYSFYNSSTIPSYILTSNEGNLDVNSSGYWDNLNTPSDINTADITNDGTYRLDSWNNLTGIPHATPSDNDVTHFSLADEIYDWVIGLGYSTTTGTVTSIATTAPISGGTITSTGTISLATATPSNGDTTHASTADQIYDWGVAAFQPLEATLTDIADGTINENLINTANPWVDNEIAVDITVTSTKNVSSTTGFVAGDDVKFYAGSGSVWGNSTCIVMEGPTSQFIIK